MKKRDKLVVPEKNTKKDIKRRGVSTIITAVILIILSLVVIVIIWVVLKNVLKGESEASEIQAKFFTEAVDITKVSSSGSNVILSLTKPRGKIVKINESIISGTSIDVDVISVVDLSGSMAVCKDVSAGCCFGNLNSFGQATMSNDILVTSLTWASAESSTLPHWAILNFSSPQTINNVTFWWAWNSAQRKYMTSQQVQIQYWDGNIYQTVATYNSGGIENMTNATINFAPISTSSIRFWQPANNGAPTYSVVMWLVEIQLNSERSPSAIVSVDSTYEEYNKDSLIDGIIIVADLPPNCQGVSRESLNNCEPICSGTLVNRLSPIQNANKKLIEEMLDEANSRIGLVIYRDFTDESFSNDLTNDAISLNSKIDSWEAYGQTCVCCGINEALSKFVSQSTSDKGKVMIVMSDGEASVTCGGLNARQDAIDAACDANATLENLKIYSIGVGDGADGTTLREISNCGGGQYYETSTGDITELIDIYKSIADSISAEYQSLTVFNFLRVVIHNQTDSDHIDVAPPEVLETKSYNIDLTALDITPPIIKIEVYPVIISKEGKEVIGPLLDSWVP